MGGELRMSWGTSSSSCPGMYILYLRVGLEQMRKEVLCLYDVKSLVSFLLTDLYFVDDSGSFCDIRPYEYLMLET